MNHLLSKFLGSYFLYSYAPLYCVNYNKVADLSDLYLDSQGVDDVLDARRFRIPTGFDIRNVYCLPHTVGALCESFCGIIYLIWNKADNTRNCSTQFTLKLLFFIQAFTDFREIKYLMDASVGNSEGASKIIVQEDFMYCKNRVVAK